RGRGYYRGRGARARGGRRGVSAPDVWRPPRGAVGAASAAGGAWGSRHAAAIHLRRAELLLGAGAQTASPVRGRRTPLGRMRRRAGPAVNTVDSRDPPCRSSPIGSFQAPVYGPNFPVLRRIQESRAPSSPSLHTVRPLSLGGPTIA